MIANTLLNGDRRSTGIYVADRQTDRQTDIPKGQWIPQKWGGGEPSKPQGLNVGLGEDVQPTKTQMAAPVTARCYKGVQTQKCTVVIYEENQSEEHDK